jgi:hypothetical protein
MGAIQRAGYEFGIEFSQISKTAALHVYKNGEFLKELSFPFEGSEPSQERIEEEIEHYLET